MRTRGNAALGAGGSPSCNEEPGREQGEGHAEKFQKTQRLAEKHNGKDGCHHKIEAEYRGMTAHRAGLDAARKAVIAGERKHARQCAPQRTMIELKRVGHDSE